MFPDLPPRRNTPLRIILFSPQDLETTVLVGSSSSCAPTSFQVVVDEEDSTDSTTSLWYVDRKIGLPSPSFFGGTILGSETTPTLRTVNAPAVVLAQLASLVDSQRHVVEVFVTDGTFTSNPGEATRVAHLPDGGTMPDTVGLDTKAWFVQVQRCE